MASEVIIGEVLAKRIYELTEKLIGEIDANTDQLIIDNENETDSKRIPLATLLSFLGSNFSDADFTLFNSVDSTKKLQFLLSSITTGITRTLTIQNKDYTIAGLDDLAAYEPLIYEPTTEPSIVTGTPNTLTLDLNNARQAIFEPRLSSGTRSINVDFTLALSNAGNGRYFDMTLSLSGTRIISLPSDFRVSVPSTIGTYDGVSSPRTLTLACGTDDVIIMIAKYIKTEAVWDLSVNEITA